MASKNKLKALWLTLAAFVLIAAGVIVSGPRLVSGQGARIMGVNEAEAVAAAAEAYFADHGELPKSFSDLERADLLPDKTSRVRLVVTSPTSIEIRYAGTGSPRNSPREINRAACRRIEVDEKGTVTNTNCYAGIRWWKFW